MTSQQIEQYRVSTEYNIWLKEIAYQLAVSNERQSIAGNRTPNWINAIYETPQEDTPNCRPSMKRPEDLSGYEEGNDYCGPEYCRVK